MNWKKYYIHLKICIKMITWGKGERGGGGGIDYVICERSHLKNTKNLCRSWPTVSRFYRTFCQTVLKKLFQGLQEALNINSASRLLWPSKKIHWLLHRISMVRSRCKDICKLWSQKQNWGWSFYNGSWRLIYSRWCSLSIRELYDDTL